MISAARHPLALSLARGYLAEPADDRLLVLADGLEELGDEELASVVRGLVLTAERIGWHAAKVISGVHEPHEAYVYYWGYKVKKLLLGGKIDRRRKGVR